MIFVPIDISRVLRRGAELRIRLNVKKPSGDAQPLTVGGVFPTITANVRTGEAKDATVVVALTQTVVSDAGGSIDFSLTPTQTAALLTAGLEYWASVWISHASWTSGIDRLELHGELDVVG